MSKFLFTYFYNYEKSGLPAWEGSCKKLELFVVSFLETEQIFCQRDLVLENITFPVHLCNMMPAGRVFGNGYIYQIPDIVQFH